MANDKYVRTYVVDGDSANRVDVSIYYDKDGYSYTDYSAHERGYYFSITPYTLTDTCKSYRAYSGGKTLAYACNRKSQASFDKATRLVDTFVEWYMQDVLDRNGLTLASDEYTIKID